MDGGNDMAEKQTTFFDEVAKLRRLQKQYFKTRDINDLHAAKDQEKLVDRLIKDRGQTHLFD